MSQPPSLEQLYAQALAAIRAKDHAQAAALLRQILIEDEEYRDASQLLARLVQARRRRWYGDPRLWGALGVLALAVLGAWLARRPPGQAVDPSPPAPEPATPVPTAIPPTGPPAAPSPGPTPDPTPIPLVWKRLYAGQEFSRDTVTAIVIHPSDPDILYVGMQRAGVYRSIDGGLSWTPIHNGLIRASVDSLLMDPGDPDVLYAGVRSGGVYRTEDGGEHWQPLTSGLEQVDSDNPSRLHGRVVAGRQVYFSNGFGLFRLRFGGWSRVDELYTVWDFALTEEGLLYLGAESDYADRLLYRSEGGGSEPTALEAPTAVDHNNRLLWEADAAGEEHIYMLRSGSLYSSRDGGRQWSSIYGCYAAAIHPHGGIAAACSGELRRSADGGRSWTASGRLPLDADRIQSLAVSPSDAKAIYLGGEGGLYQSQDGGQTWQPRNSGLGAAWLELDVHPWATSALYVQDGSCVQDSAPLYRSVDGGGSWTLIREGGCGLAIDADGQTLYRGGVRSPDGGQTWLGRELPAGCTASSVSAHPREVGLVYAAGSNSACRSTDTGRTWEVFGPGSVPRDYASESKIFFASQPGRLYLVPFFQMYVSNNGGGFWRQCEEWTSWNPLTDARLAVDATDDDRLLRASLGQGVWISQDGCDTWLRGASGTRGQFVNSILFDPRRPTVAYAGTDNGAFVSFDRGESWTAANDGLLGALVVYSLGIDAQGQVYAATPYGIFRLEAR